MDELCRPCGIRLRRSNSLLAKRNATNAMTTPTHPHGRRVRRTLCLPPIPPFLVSVKWHRQQRLKQGSHPSFQFNLTARRQRVPESRRYKVIVVACGRFLPRLVMRFVLLRRRQAATERSDSGHSFGRIAQRRPRPLDLVHVSDRRRL